MSLAARPIAVAFSSTGDFFVYRHAKRSPGSNRRARMQAKKIALKSLAYSMVGTGRYNEGSDVTEFYNTGLCDSIQCR